MRVLIVDDEQKVRRHLIELISAIDGMQVAGEAEDGKKALEFFANNPVDIVITDIRMPEMDGLALLQEIENIGISVGRIILSGYGDFEYAKTAMKQGIRNYLLKPVQSQQLEAAIQNAVVQVKQLRNTSENLKKSVVAQKQRLLNALINGYKPREIEGNLQFHSLFEGEGYLYIIEVADEDTSLVIENARRLQDEKNTFTSCGVNRLICYSEKAKDAKEYANFLKEYFSSQNSEAYVAYGVIGLEKDSFSQIYRSLELLLEASWLVDGEHILSVDMVPSLMHQTDWAILKEWNHEKLDEAISEHNVAIIEQQAILFFESIFDKPITEEIAHSLYSQEILRIMRMVIDQGGDPNQVSHNAITLFEVLQRNRKNELIHWYKQLCLDVSSYLATLGSKRRGSISEQIIAQFEADPSGDYSLAALGKCYYMSPVYLGQLFKQETGKTLHNWLTEHRIQKANEWLLTTQMPIYEISEKLGYQNLRSFYAAYKKCEECTPTEFRERRGTK